VQVLGGDLGGKPFTFQWKNGEKSAEGGAIIEAKASIILFGKSKRIQKDRWVIQQSWVEKFLFLPEGTKTLWEISGGQSIY